MTRPVPSVRRRARSCAATPCSAGTIVTPDEEGDGTLEVQGNGLTVTMRIEGDLSIDDAFASDVRLIVEAVHERRWHRNQ